MRRAQLQPLRSEWMGKNGRMNLMRDEYPHQMRFLFRYKLCLFIYSSFHWNHTRALSNCCTCKAVKKGSKWLRRLCVHSLFEEPARNFNIVATSVETEIFPLGDQLGDLANQTLIGNHTDLDQLICHYGHIESLVNSAADPLTELR